VNVYFCIELALTCDGSPLFAIGGTLSQIDTSASELNHVQTCSEENNLKLNCSKSKEIIFTGHGTRIKPVIIPPPCLNMCDLKLRYVKLITSNPVLPHAVEQHGRPAATRLRSIWDKVPPMANSGEPSHVNANSHYQ